MENVRVKNLKTLIKQFDSQNQAGEAMGIGGPALSRIMTGGSAIGTKRARDIERKLKLREGWLDEYQDDTRAEWIQGVCSALAGGDDVEAAMDAADAMIEGARHRFKN